MLRPGARNRTEIMLVLETSRRTNVAHPNDSVVSNQETPRNQFPDFEGSPWLTFPLLARETLGLEARRRAQPPGGLMSRWLPGGLSVSHETNIHPPEGTVKLFPPVPDDQDKEGSHDRSKTQREDQVTWGNFHVMIFFSDTGEEAGQSARDRGEEGPDVVHDVTSSVGLLNNPPDDPSDREPPEDGLEAHRRHLTKHTMATTAATISQGHPDGTDS